MKYELSKSGIRFLMSVEDIRYIPYKNKKGNYVVGLNHVGDDVIPGRVYTTDEIERFFEHDKHTIETEVNKVFDGRFMTQNMYDALFSFTYDVGKLENTELGKMIKKNPFDERIQEFWEYTYTSNFKNSVAVKRRKMESMLYMKDITV